MSTEIFKKQKFYTLFLLVLVFTSSHIDRNIIAILLQPIKETFLVSDTQLGFLTGVTFALFYATLAMPMAMWADRHNRRNLIALSISLWSLMTAFCGLAFQYWQLLLFRIGVGVGEAGSGHRIDDGRRGACIVDCGKQVGPGRRRPGNDGPIARTARGFTAASQGCADRYLVGIDGNARPGPGARRHFRARNLEQTHHDRSAESLAERCR